MLLLMATTTNKFGDSNCPLCLKDIDCDKFFTVTSKDLETLAACASVYGDLELKTYLLSYQSVVRVHERCRKKYANRRELVKFSRGSDVCSLFPAKKLRSSIESFDFKHHCLYC